MTTIQIKQQEIRSLLQNFDWETNPDWHKQLIEIEKQIAIYWEKHLKRAYNLAD